MSTFARSPSVVCTHPVPVPPAFASKYQYYIPTSELDRGALGPFRPSFSKVRLQSRAANVVEVQLTETPDQYLVWVAEYKKFVFEIISREGGQWFTTPLTVPEIKNLFGSDAETGLTGSLVCELAVPVPASAAGDDRLWDVVVELKGVFIGNTSFDWYCELRHIQPTTLLDRSVLGPRVAWGATATAPMVVSPPPSVSLESTKRVRDPDRTTKEESNEYGLEDFSLQSSDSDPAPVVELVPRSEVYYSLYKAAVHRATAAKEVALAAFTEARLIRDTYLILDGDDSDGLPGLDEEDR